MKVTQFLLTLTLLLVAAVIGAPLAAVDNTDGPVTVAGANCGTGIGKDLCYKE
ncbi:hypothetical protein BJX62DRAFT_245384 [Aspergillus germanicus]